MPQTLKDFFDLILEWILFLKVLYVFAYIILSYIYLVPLLNMDYVYIQTLQLSPLNMNIY